MNSFQALPILKTKLYCPYLPSVLTSRPHLIERLNGFRVPQQKLILLSAPAGFGKTTLLQTWLSQLEADVAVAWVTLDEADNDASRFLAYLVAALQQVDPALGRSLQTFLHNEAPSPSLITAESNLDQLDPSLDVPLTLLINDIAALTRPLLLVLDDYHLIDSESIHKGLTFLLDYLPPLMGLVIASRDDPPLPLARLRLRGQLTELKAAELRFSAEETFDFFEQALDQSLTRNMVARLDEKTEGWVAALQAVALSLKDRTDVSTFIDTFSGSHRYILDYLVEETLLGHPPPVQAFLLQTAVLERLCGPLCDAILGEGSEMHRDTAEEKPPQTSQMMLKYLEAKNLFLIPLDNTGDWYRYHHLFADFLRRQLQQHQPGRVADLHRRAADWFTSHELWTEAIRHIFAAGDVERAAALIEHIGRTLWQQGELSTLTGWLKQLPKTVRRQSAHLCLLEAWTLFPSRQLVEIEAWIEAAEAALPAKATEITPLRGEIALVRAVAARMQGDVRRTIDLSRSALASLSPDDWSLRSAAALNLGHGLRQMGDSTAAGTAFDEAIALGQAADNLYTVILAMANRADLYVEQGHLQTAEPLYHQALRLAAEKGGATLPVTSVAHIGLGKLSALSGDLDAAETQLRLGIKRAKQGDHLHLLLDGYSMLAQVKEAQGDTAKATQLRQQATRITDQANLRRTLYELRQPTDPPLSLKNPLSQREIEVLRQVATGASNQAIAEEMVITIHTVKKHVSHILQKLDVSSRTEAVARARALGLI